MPVPGASGGLAKEEPLGRALRTISAAPSWTARSMQSEWTLMHRYNKATELLEQALNVSTFSSADRNSMLLSPFCNASCRQYITLLLAWASVAGTSEEPCIEPRHEKG